MDDGREPNARGARSSAAGGPAVGEQPAPRPRTPPRLDELLARTSRTFALNIPLLPEPTRGEVTVAYLLFRVADTLEDSTAWAPARKCGELGRLAALLRRPSTEAAAALADDWRAAPPCAHEGYRDLLAELPAVLAFEATLSPRARRSIRRHLVRTIERMTTFVAREREQGLELRDVDDLRSYCYAVAGIVGEMLTELFLLERDGLAPVAERLSAGAATFGEALQLVNILKDAASDSREGRNFLPAGVDRSRVFALAREDLRAAGRYCSTLHAAGAPRGLVEFTTLPVLLAWATLDRVEQSGPGAKLTRPEVGAIIQQMYEALDGDRFERLWSRRRGVS